LVDGLEIEIDGEMVEITHASQLWRYVRDKEPGEWCKVLVPFASTEEAESSCNEGRPKKKGNEDNRSTGDLLTLARRLGFTFGEGAQADACAGFLKTSDLGMPAIKVAVKEGASLRRKRSERRPEKPAEKPRECYSNETELDDTINTLAADSSDGDIKAIMLRLHHSNLSEARKRKALRLMRRKVRNEERDRMQHIWELWDDVTWHADWEPPNTVDCSEIDLYMSRRYVGVIWGKDYVYIDRSKKQVAGHYYHTLFDAYRSTKYLNIDAEGKEKTESNWFKWWAENGSVRRYDGGVVFKLRGHVGAHELNLYQRDIVHAAPGDWSRFRRHLFENICDSNPYLFAFLIGTLAQWVQQPDRKMGVAIVLRSPQRGTGKSKVADWVCELFPLNSTLISSADELFDRFNVQLATSIVVNVDDAGWAGDKKHDGQFRSMITREKQPFQPKGIDRTMINDFCRYVVTSNNEWVVPASHGERRWFFLDVNPRQERNTKYFAVIDEEMEAGGLEAMKYDLLHLEIPKWLDLRNPPQTEGLRGQADVGLEPHKLWWQEALKVGGFRLAPDQTGAQEWLDWPDNGELEVGCDDLRASCGDFTMDRPGGRNKLRTPEQFGKDLKDWCGKEVRHRASEPDEEGKRPRIYRLPPLGEVRKRYTEKMGVTFDSVSQVVDHRVAGLSERLRWSLGFGRGVVIPPVVPPEALASWAGWGVGMVRPRHLDEAA
jgi:Family of unknown function (DUF5906)